MDNDKGIYRNTELQRTPNDGEFRGGAMKDLSIPSALQPLVTGYDFEPVALGDSAARVFRLRQNAESRRFLKCGPINSGLKEEACRLKWLSGRVRVSSVIAFVAEEDREFLLTEALFGRDGTEAGRENPEAVVVGLAQELQVWHSQLWGIPYEYTEWVAILCR